MMLGNLQVFLEMHAFAYLNHVLALQYLCIADAEVELLTCNVALRPHTVA